eukprot:11189666-Lingulodinium_polyedra.AAC.1
MAKKALNLVCGFEQVALDRWRDVSGLLEQQRLFGAYFSPRNFPKRAARPHQARAADRGPLWGSGFQDC